MTMKATAAAACMAFAAMTATVSESAEKDNGIPEVARPEVARAVEEAARRPPPTAHLIVLSFHRNGD